MVLPNSGEGSLGCPYLVPLVGQGPLGKNERSNIPRPVAATAGPGGLCTPGLSGLTFALFICCHAQLLVSV